MTVLDAAIALSLDSLQDSVNDHEQLITPYTLREMYCSLCVLENKQQALVSVLCRMRDVCDSIAWEICVRLASMSLCKFSRGKEGYGAHIHDLHLDFVRRMAGETRVRWLRRLLDGNLPRGNCPTTTNGDTNALKMLEYTRETGGGMTLRTKSTFDEMCVGIFETGILDSN